VRLYEAHGARGTAHLRLGMPVRQAHFANLLEDPGAPAHVEGHEIEVPYRPYEVVTLLVE